MKPGKYHRRYEDCVVDGALEAKELDERCVIGYESYFVRNKLFHVETRIPRQSNHSCPKNKKGCRGFFVGFEARHPRLLIFLLYRCRHGEGIVGVVGKDENF